MYLINSETTQFKYKIHNFYFLSNINAVFLAVFSQVLIELVKYVLVSFLQIFIEVYVIFLITDVVRVLGYQFQSNMQIRWLQGMTVTIHDIHMIGTFFNKPTIFYFCLGKVLRMGKYSKWQNTTRTRYYSD